jgi:hypothetical protein
MRERPIVQIERLGDRRKHYIQLPEFKTLKFFLGRVCVAALWASNVVMNAGVTVPTDQGNR